MSSRRLGIVSRGLLVLALLTFALTPVLVHSLSGVLSNIGWTYVLQASQLDLAQADVQRTIDSELLRRGQESLEAGQRLNPANGSAQLGLCQILLRQNLQREAVSCLHRAWSQGHTNVDALLQLGTIAAQNGDTQMALYAWQQAGAGRYFHTQAGQASRAGDMRSALSLYRRAVEIDPALDESYLEIGKIHYDRGEFELACRAFQTKVGIAPDRAGYAWLGRTQQVLGDVDAALQAYAHAAALGELWYGYLAAGDLERAQGNLKEAMAWYMRAREAFPEVPAVLLRMGNTAVAQADYPQARSYFQEALTQAPLSPDGYEAMARWYFVQGAFADAESWAQEALAHGLRPDYWSYKMRGEIYWNTGKCKLAARNYQEALQSATVPAEEIQFLTKKIDDIRSKCHEAP